MRLLFLMFVSAVCVLFLLKLRLPKTKSIYYITITGMAGETSYSLLSKA